jgi:hypothetical protein
MGQRGAMNNGEREVVVLERCDGSIEMDGAPQLLKWPAALLF